MVHPSAPHGTATWPPPSPTPPPAPGWAPPQPPPAGGIATVGAPARPSAPPRPRAVDPAPKRLLLLVVAAGLALELGLRGGVANLLVVAGVVLVVAALVTDGRLQQRGARMVALAALVPAACLFLRASPWLAGANLALATGLLASAIVLGRSGSAWDTTATRIARRILAALPSAFRAPADLAALAPRPSQQRADRVRRVAVAALICVPVLGVVMALLASADPVFAGFLQPDLHLGPLTGHLLFGVVLVLGCLCVVGAAATDHVDDAPAGRFGVLETLTMLGLTAVVLGLFVVAQLVALTGAGERLVEQAGLTPSEYARSGFFQLCWATALILGLLGLIRGLAHPEAVRARPVRVLAAVVPLLALGLVAVSLRRLALYDDAFGLTMLRLSVTVAASWMGVVLCLISARNAGLRADRQWVLGAAATAALALVLVADVANPEAFVVRHNVARAERGATFDGAYLATLSDDAVPAVGAELRGLEDPELASALTPALRCDDDQTGAAALNIGAARASSERLARCPNGPPS